MSNQVGDWVNGRRPFQLSFFFFFEFYQVNCEEIEEGVLYPIRLLLPTASVPVHEVNGRWVTRTKLNQILIPYLSLWQQLWVPSFSLMETRRQKHTRGYCFVGLLLFFCVTQTANRPLVAPFCMSFCYASLELEKNK